MNLFKLGVEIDPTKGASGARTLESAVERLEKAMLSASRAASAMPRPLGQTAGAATSAASAMTVMERATVSAARGMGSLAHAGGFLYRSLLALPGLLQAISLAAAPFRAGIGLFGAATGKAGEFEGQLVRLAVLRRDFEKARDEIKQIQRFADITPFESPELLSSFIALDPIVKDLGGMEKALRMVGDAAAGTQKPIEEVTRWFVRFYAGIKAGAPVGVALDSLKDLGVITQKTQQALLDMTKDNDGGKNFAKIWAIAKKDLDAFTDSMELQSKTWGGMMSTLGDAWGAVKRELGLPIVSALKPLLQDLSAGFQALAANIKGFAPQIEDITLTIVATIKVLANPANYALIWATIKQGASALWDEILNLLTQGAEQLWNLVRTGATALWDWLLAQAAANAKFIGDLISNEIKKSMTGGIKERAGNVLDAILGTGGAKPLFGGGASSGSINALMGSTASMSRQSVSPVTINVAGKAEIPGGLGDITSALFGGGTRPAAGGAALGPNVKSSIREQAQALKDEIEMADPFGSLLGKIDEEKRALKSRTGGLDNSFFESKGGVGKGGVGKAEATSVEGAKASAKANKEAADAISKRAEEYERLREQFEATYGTEEEKLRGLLRPLEELRSKGVITMEELSKATEKVTADFRRSQMNQFELIVDDWGNLKQQAVSASADILQSIEGNMSGALAAIATQTEDVGEAFNKMALGIINDITSIIIKLVVQYTLQQLIGGLSGGGGGGFGAFLQAGLGGGGTATVAHDGSGQGQRVVPYEIFAQARRLHEGGSVLKPGEVPAILEPSEMVLTRQQQRDIKERLSNQATSDGKPSASVTILNVTDRREIDEHLVTNPATILNVISRNQGAIRRMLGVKKTA